MVIVLPVCSTDAEAALRNLKWIRQLDGVLPFHCVVSHDSDFNVNVVLEQARLSFQTVTEHIYRPPKLGPWPGPQNAAWQAAALHVHLAIKQPWFWWEQDAIPLRKGWLSAIQQEYANRKKPFLGALCTVKNTQHLTGIAVYPPDVPQRAPNMMLVTRAPFDGVGGKAVLDQSAITPLIQVNNNGHPDSFTSTRDLEWFSPEAVIHHRCKDDTLIRLLKGSPAKSVSLWSKLTSACTPKTTTCFHSGDLGDIIYGLLFVKQFAPIKLFLGPDLNTTVREPMTKDKVDWLLPLLRKQPWIQSVEFVDKVPQTLDYNLNNFRKTWFSPRRMSTRLFEAYAEHYQRPAPAEDVPWLVVDPISDEDRPIVISRSTRYRNDGFPWKSVSSQYAGRMTFVGLEKEYAEWCMQYGKTAEYRTVQDALELARVISGARLFIGNQSFPMALALALNVPLIQEVSPRTPDCVFKRKNGIFWRQGPLALPNISPLRRYVTTKPNSKGMIELGPCADAGGLGDTLTITPLASRLKNAVVCLPPSMEQFAPLFANICPIAFTDNYPVFKHVGGMHMAKAKLKLFKMDSNDFMPVVKITESEQRWAIHELAEIQNPIGFVSSCSPTWQHIRSRPLEFWKPFVEELSKRFTVIQFGRNDTPLVDGCQRAKFYSVRKLAAIYSVIGSYFGVDTGDYHLMLAVGGKCLVARPGDVEGYNPVEWSYPESSKVKYVPLDNPEEISQSLSFL